MNRAALLIVSYVLVVCFPGIAKASTVSTIDSYVKKELRSTNAPGAQISVLANGQIVFRRAYGMANVDARTPMSLDTEMLIASNTKMFTGFAFQLLAQQHLVNLDGPINRYVPELPRKVGQVTLRQLLSHRGGIKDSADDFGSHDDSALGAAIAKWNDGYLFTTPGDVFSYSNLGYDLAGYILERVVGVPYADALNQLIFKPAGMPHTTARLDMAITFPFSAGYKTFGRSVAAVRPFPDNAAEKPSGGVFTNANDLMRFLQIVMNEGTWQGSRVFPSLAVAAFLRATAEPAVNSDRATQYANGLNFVYVGPELMLQHSGSIAGFGSLVRFDPKAGFAIVILTNKTGGLLLNTFNGVTNLLIPETVTPQPTKAPIPLSEAEKRELVGRYVNDLKYLAIDLLIVDGRLVLRQVGSTDESAVIKLGQDSYAADGERFAIVRDSTSRIKYLKIVGHALLRLSAPK